MREEIKTGEEVVAYGCYLAVVKGITDTRFIIESEEYGEEIVRKELIEKITR